MNTNSTTVNRKRKLEDEDLNTLSREDLIERIRILSAHNNQLKNTIKKQNSDKEEQINNQDKKKKGRTFDFSKCHKRKILLRFLYLGWDYQGFACQEGSMATIGELPTILGLNSSKSLLFLFQNTTSLRP